MKQKQAPLVCLLIFACGVLGWTQQVSIVPGSGPARAAQAPAELLDINTAGAAQLAALPGMGLEYARRVVAGRPYTAKNQLSTRGILPAAEYERISGLIVAHRLAKK